MEKHGVRLSTLRDCFEFLQWLHSGGGKKMQDKVARELVTRYGNSYNRILFTGKLPPAVSEFLEHVSTFYKKLVATPIEKSYVNPRANDVTDALLECVPKFLAALYFLLYNVDYKFEEVGGGKWRYDNPGWETTWVRYPWQKEYGGGLQDYLRASGSYQLDVIPGGFGPGEVTYGYDYGSRYGYPYGEDMTKDIEKMLGKNTDHNYFRDVFFTTVISKSGLQKSNTANVLALVKTFCEIVISVKSRDGVLKTAVQKKNTCLDWEELKQHCKTLEQQLGKLFKIEGFSFTGQARRVDELNTETFAGETAEWFRNNLRIVQHNVKQINKSFPVDDTLYLTALRPFATKNIFPYGFIFGKGQYGTMGEAWKTLSDHWDSVIDMLGREDDGLDKLKRILDGEPCRPPDPPPNPRPQPEPAPRPPRPARPVPTQGASRTSAGMTTGARHLGGSLSRGSQASGARGVGGNNRRGGGQNRGRGSGAQRDRGRGPGPRGAPGAKGAQGSTSTGTSVLIQSQPLQPQNDLQSHPQQALPPTAASDPGGPGPAGKMTAHGVKLDTLKDCLRFLAWLHGDRGMQGQVIDELAARIEKYYNNSTFKLQFKFSLESFLRNVSEHYGQISKDKNPGNFSSYDKNIITEAFSECLPKVHAAFSLLLFHVDYTYTPVGGGKWALLDTTTGGSLGNAIQTFFTGFNGVIDGGFKPDELQNVTGQKLAENLNAALKRNTLTPDLFTSVLFDNLVDSSWSNLDTGNVLLLLWAFCEYVETHKGDSSLRTKLQEELRRRTMCFDWNRLVEHCTKLRMKLSKLFGDSSNAESGVKPFTTTGRAFDPTALKPDAFAETFERWFKTHWQQMTGALETIKGSVEDFAESPESFTPENIYPYGIVLNKDHKNKWAGGLTNLFGVLETLGNSDDGDLKTLKDILNGYTCPAQPPPKKPEVPPAKVPEAPKEVVPEKKVPVPKRPEGAQNQGKKAESSPTPNNGQSEGSSPTSPGGDAVSHPPSGDQGASGPRGPTMFPQVPGSPVQNTDQTQQAPPQPPPAPPPLPGAAGSDGQPGVGQGSTSDVTSSIRPGVSQVTAHTPTPGVPGQGSGPTGGKGTSHPGGGGAGQDAGLGGGQQSNRDSTQPTNKGTDHNPSNVATPSSAPVPGQEEQEQEKMRQWSKNAIQGTPIDENQQSTQYPLVNIDPHSSPVGGVALMQDSPRQRSKIISLMQHGIDHAIHHAKAEQRLKQEEDELKKEIQQKEKDAEAKWQEEQKEAFLIGVQDDVSLTGTPFEDELLNRLQDQRELWFQQKDQKDLSEQMSKDISLAALMDREKKLIEKFQNDAEKKHYDTLNQRNQDALFDDLKMTVPTYTPQAARHGCYNGRQIKNG
ncbi:ribosome binding protein, putative [Babesia ovata]|uniref:Ribosome binding protein, putative n=1 Tax=Babesia ovata TaxID=189622 RepID=A0A2H6KG54_9APIC|nr:ribosome binding protein, putative [Babesia ovata]GBE61976.1 ribosome binding protein, putative [Babesia ovata]